MFSFADNVKVSGIETVPEGFRAFYEESDDGSFKLSDSSAVKAAVASISSLDKALTDARKESKDHKTKLGSMDLTPLSEYGESAGEIAAAVTAKIEELQGRIKGGKESKISTDRIKEELSKVHAVEMGVKEKRIDALQGQLHKELVTNKATSAIVESKGNTELLLPFVEKQAKVIEEEGKVYVAVTDEKGDRRFSGTTGEPMTVHELVAEMKSQEKYGALFTSDLPSGGGTKPGAPGVGGPQKKAADMTPKEKISAGLAKRAAGQ